MVPFRCAYCATSRQLELPCEPDEEAFLASFARCVKCGRRDRSNWVLYVGVLALKMVASVGFFALFGAVYHWFFWVGVPLGVAALWADHLRFMRRLDLTLMSAVVRGGAPSERLQRP